MKSNLLKASVLAVAATVVGYCYCLLLPVITFKKVEGESYESRYIEGAGAIATLSKQKALVPVFRPPVESESFARLAICLKVYGLIAMTSYLFFLRRRRFLYKDGHRLFFKPGELMPIDG